MNTAFHPHRGFLDAYDVQILNHADHLEPILRDRGILDRVSTVFSIGIGAGHLECQLARELGFSLAYVERSPPMIEAIRQNIAGYGISRQISAEYTCEFEAIPTDATYDLILSLDSWYLIGRNRESLQKALALRATGGRLLIQLMTSHKQLYWELDQVRGLMASQELSSAETEAAVQAVFDLERDGHLETRYGFLLFN